MLYAPIFLRMIWIRHFAKKIFGPYMGQIPEEKAWKYMNITRMVYFFSASTLGFILWHQSKEIDKKALESGLPMIIDHSGAHKTFRQGKAERGTMYTYKPGEGLQKEVLTKEDYYDMLEREALERAKEAQRKLISEGRELPEDAIKLI